MNFSLGFTATSLIRKCAHFLAFVCSSAPLHDCLNSLNMRYYFMYVNSDAKLFRYPNENQKQALAQSLGISHSQVCISLVSSSY